MLYGFAMTQKQIWMFAIVLCLAGLWGCDPDLHNVAPQAQAGGGRTVLIGEQVQLDGSGSWDSNDDTLTYQWAIIKLPDNSNTSFAEPQVVNPVFIPDMPGIYVIQLVVSDGNQSDRDSIVIEVDDLTRGQPQAGHVEGFIKIGDDKTVALGQRVDLKPDVKVVEQRGVVQYTWHHSNEANVEQYIFRDTSLNIIGQAPQAVFIPRAMGNYTIVLLGIVELNEPDVTTGALVIATVDTIMITVVNDKTYVPSLWRVPLPEGGHGAVKAQGCSGCHQDDIVMLVSLLPAGQMPLWHKVVNANCDGCHSVEAWAPATAFVHELAVGSCVSCHDGVVTTGLSSNHVDRDNPSTQLCERCHVTLSWKEIAVTEPPPDSGSVDPLPAQGANHISPTDQCHACHGISGKVVFVDHGHVFGVCRICHIAPVIPNTVHEILVDTACNECHVTTSFKVKIYNPSGVFNHSIITEACVSCHNGTIRKGKPNTHIPASDACDACHNVVHFKPIVKVDHSALNDMSSCVSCHDNSLAKGQPDNHLATTNACGECHTAQAWLPATDQLSTNP